MSIESLVDLVPYGESKRFNCCLCGGNNSLSITKVNGRVLYNCYKAKCTMQGSRITNMTNAEGKAILTARKPILRHRTEAKERFELPDYWVQGLASKKCFQMLLNHNAIESYVLGLFKVAYDPKQDRLVYLKQNKQGLVVGGIGRSFGNRHPKVYNYPNSDTAPFICGTGNTAVLVEDCASACSIGRFKEYTGIALCGTELTNEVLFYIISNFSTIIIALDKDATAKSIKIKRAIEYYKQSVQIWKLNKDFKHLDHTDMFNYIQENKNPVITNTYTNVRLSS